MIFWLQTDISHIFQMRYYEALQTKGLQSYKPSKFAKMDPDFILKIWFISVWSQKIKILAGLLMYFISIWSDPILLHKWPKKALCLVLERGFARLGSVKKPLLKTWESKFFCVNTTVHCHVAIISISFEALQGPMLMSSMRV